MRKAFIYFTLVGCIANTVFIGLYFLIAIFADFVFTPALYEFFKIDIDTDLIKLTANAFRIVFAVIVLLVLSRKTKKWYFFFLISLGVYFLAKLQIEGLFFFSGSLMIVGGICGILHALNLLLKHLIDRSNAIDQ